MAWRRMLLGMTCAIAGISGVLFAGDSAAKPLYSQLSAMTFHQIAHELYSYEYASDAEVAQAMVFLEAAGQLDPRAEYVLEGILGVAPKLKDDDYAEIVYEAFQKYVEGDVDLEVTKKAIQYLLADKNSRGDRENVIKRLLDMTRGKNKLLSSELATQLAILTAEKADFENAEKYFQMAYHDDPYNISVFQGLGQIYENTNRTMTPVEQLKQVQIAMILDPLDINASMSFAHYAETQGMYDVAMKAYEYSARLFVYLSPGEPLASSIYMPWAIASYNTEQGKDTCLEIADWIRSSGSLDLVLEALAGRAAEKTGDIAKSQKLLKEAAEKAEEKLKPDVINFDVDPVELAWFYCFGMPDAKKSLIWANKAYSSDPNSPHVKAVLAYCLVTGDQDEQEKQVMLDSAKTMLSSDGADPLYEQNQIAALAMGLVRLAENDKEGAVKSLKLAIGMDRMSLAAEKAIELLDSIGADYEKLAVSQEVVKQLQLGSGTKIVPDFEGIDQVASLKFTINTGSLSYGHALEGQLTIVNKRSEPLIFSDDAMIKGYIRIDAQVRGDISVKIPNLISKRIRPASMIEQGQQVVIPMNLTTGMLRRLLVAYPQASLEIDFTIYFDPVVDAEGNIKNRIEQIQLLTAKVMRPGFELTRQSLMRNLEMLASGQFKQKVRAGQLFAGLLLEQTIQKKLNLPYRVIKVDKSLLTSAVKRSLADEDWIVRTQTMSLLLGFTPPLDYELLQAISGNLSKPEWPDRMLTIYLLSRVQGENFKPVLGQISDDDDNEVVRKMVAALDVKPKVTIPDSDADK